MLRNRMKQTRNRDRAGQDVSCTLDEHDRGIHEILLTVERKLLPGQARSINLDVL